MTIADPAGAAADRGVLEALYQATGGPNWTNNTNWLTDAPLSEWFGVTTESGRVTELNLAGNGLRGLLPPALAELGFLQSLRLGARWDFTLQRIVHNELSGPIPTELGNLTRLQHLDLFGNELNGADSIRVGTTPPTWHT